jgi:ubiquinone/menaquinone biosynthesis C-methylase UbiE
VTGWWGRHVVPRLLDTMLDNDEVAKLRATACAGLHGRLLEVGFGSGLDVEHYPEAVTSVSAIEPSDVAWRKALPRVEAARSVVRREGLDGQRLALADDSHDCALSAFTLCTIPDAGAALAEIRRVLRPGGRLHFVEHGLSEDAGVATWQHRLAPLNKALVGGCHLDRPIARMIADAGFEIGALQTFYEPGPAVSRPFGYLYLGWAATG